MGDPVRAVVADASPTQRMRTCLRCERVADAARKGGWQVPPVQQARSWVKFGVQYWGALCLECEDIERQSRAVARSGMTHTARRMGGTQ
jgi:hypothetical protein